MKPPEEPVATVRQKLVDTFAAAAAAAAALRSEPRCRNARTPAGRVALRSGLRSCLEAPEKTLMRGAAACSIVRRPA
jgi:hypothetical protein